MNDVLIGLPHATTDKAKTFYRFRPQCSQPPPQRHLQPSLPELHQVSAVRNHLVDDREEVVGPQAVAPVNLVRAHTLDSPQFAEGQALTAQTIRPSDAPLRNWSEIRSRLGLATAIGTATRRRRD